MFYFSRSFFVLTFLSFSTILFSMQPEQYEPNDDSTDWDWSRIDLERYKGKRIVDIFKNSTFKFHGVGVSDAQVQGIHPQTDWAEWLQRPEQEAKGLRYSERACDFWEHYRGHVDMLADAGFNAFRFSTEWVKVQPGPGQTDQTVLDFYERMCQACKNRSVQPVVTLFHETTPQWFVNLKRTVRVDNDNFPHLKKLCPEGTNTVELSGWEDPENRWHFVAFAKAVFERLCKYNPIIFTFNRAPGCALKGFFRGERPPGKRSLPLAAQAMCTMYRAHVNTYDALKLIAASRNVSSTIGILENRYWLYPWNRYNPYDQLCVLMANYLQHQVSARFLTTGVFEVKMPFNAIPVMANMTYIDKNIAAGKKVLDVLGVNCYGGAYMNGTTVCHDPAKILTDNSDYTVFPEAFSKGLIDAYETIAKPLNVPMYLTEWGIATKSDSLRRLFYKQGQWVVGRLIEKGVPILGIFIWSWCNNDEWGHRDPKDPRKRTKPYGVVHIDFDHPDKIRTFKLGADELIRFVNECQGKKIPELRFVPSERLL